MAGLSKETRILILQFLWETMKENPTRIVRGKELMDHLEIDEYSLKANIRLLTDLKWVKLFSKDIDVRSFIKITDEGIRQVEHLSDG